MLNKSLFVADKVINVVMIIFFILLILIGGYAFLDSYIVYEDVVLDTEIVNLKPKLDENYNFNSLKEINPDVEGWITIFETSIDYPVLHSKDNLDYLNQDYKKNYTAGGSIFVDYRNNHNFTDDYTIIYGHNMMTGQMFSDIKRYENKEYFDQHLYGVLYTEDVIYKLEVIYLAKVNAFNDDVYNLITYANGRNVQLSELVKEKSLVSNLPNDYTKLLLLSTCDSYGSNDRTVLLASLSETNNEETKRIAEEVKSKNESNSMYRAGSNYIPFEQIRLWLIILILLLIISVLARKIYIRNRKTQNNIKKLD